MKYAEKEILVFNAFKKLLFSNSNINKLTVSEIAKAAGIGKGTIYEYFKSKEDIIVKSIIYNIDYEINILLKEVDLEPSFEKSCYILIENITNNLNNICPYIKLLFNNIKLDEIHAQFDKEMDEFSNLKNLMDSILDKILEKGINEKIVNDEYDIEYQRYVLVSACTGITNTIHSQINTDIDKYKSYAYNIIKKSLS